MRLEGQRVLLTGASRGIGRALAEHLVAAGAQVLAVARDDAALRVMAGRFGAALEPHACDLGNARDRSRLLDGLGRVDGLINNAGVQVTADHTRARADPAAEIAVNLTAPLHLTAALLPAMVTRRAGFVVNVTSALALHPKTAAPVYCATKAGLRSFTRALRYQAAGYPGLLICEAILPLVDTAMTAGRGRGKLSADAVARAVLAGLAHNRPEIWVGKTRALRLIDRLSPALAARILRGPMDALADQSRHAS